QPYISPSGSANDRTKRGPRKRYGWQNLKGEADKRSRSRQPLPFPSRLDDMDFAGQTQTSGNRDDLTAIPMRMPYFTSSDGRMIAPLQSRALGRSRHLVEVLDVRSHAAIDTLHLRIGRLNDVILVRRMSAAAMAQPEVPGRQAEWRIREHVARPGSGVPRHEDR